MNPTITTLQETKLVGMQVQMNFLSNKTQELWQSFMPRLKEIERTTSENLYSVEIYPSLSYFDQFNPTTDYEKWAAVQVSDHDEIPAEMEKLVLPGGLYGVFHFKGAASEAPKIYQYILGDWIPNSTYELDHRPHFALMGEKYKNNDPDSEEEIWIPIKPKSDE